MLTLKAPEGGSRSFEAMVVYHLLLSSVETISTHEKTVNTAIRMCRKQTSLHSIETADK